jgi:hypothetical protein
MGFKHEPHRLFGVEYHSHPLCRSLSTQDFDNCVVEEFDAWAAFRINAVRGGHGTSRLRLD